LNSLGGTVEKAKLLLLFEGNISELYKEVQRMSELVKYLDFPPVHELDEKMKDLLPIEENLTSQSDLYLSQDSEFQAVLEAYNQSIRDINAQFLYIESLIEKAEA
jgi:Dynactin subunit p22